MTSFPFDLSAAFLATALFSNWTVGRLLENHTASVLSTRGAYVSRELPDCIQGISAPQENDPLGSCFRYFLRVAASRVHEVWIEDLELQDHDLMLLAFLPDLEYLLIDSESITGAGVEYLLACSSLQTLDVFSNWYISVADLTALRNLPRLRELTIPIPRGDNLAGLRELTRLERFVVRDLAISPDDLNELRQLKQLKELSFENCWRRNAMPMLDFAGWPALESLRLTSVQLSSDEWQSIFGNQRLRRLFVEDMVLFSRQLAEIGRLTDLRALHFRNIRFDSDEVLDFAKIPKIEYLTFLDTNTTDAHIEGVDRLEDLHQLVLVGTSVSDLAIQRLSFGPKFRCIFVDESFSGNAETLFRSRNSSAQVYRGGGFVFDVIVPIEGTQSHDQR